MIKLRNSYNNRCLWDNAGSDMMPDRYNPFGEQPQAGRQMQRTVPAYDDSYMSPNAMPAYDENYPMEYAIPESPDTANQSYMPSAASNIPETLSNPIYTAGYLSTQIGKNMRVEFLIGNTLTDRVGTLLEVGSSYIVLQSIDPGSTIMCDIYAIKFVTIINRNTNGPFAGLV